MKHVQGMLFYVTTVRELQTYELSGVNPLDVL